MACILVIINKLKAMKNFIWIISITLIFVSCNGNPDKQAKKSTNFKPKKIEAPVTDKTYGNPVTTENAADARRLPDLLKDSDSKEVKLIGKVENVCQSTGCWLELGMGDTELIHITFKDNNFTVPKDIAEKTVLVNGIASKEIISVDIRKKMAAAEGLSKEEINSITEPLIEYTYESTGVVVK